MTSSPRTHRSRSTRLGGRPNAGPPTRSARRRPSNREEFRFRGRIVRVRPDEDVVVLRVLGGNAAARRHLGRELTLELAGARLVVADRDRDGRLSVADLRERELAVAWTRCSSDLDGSARLPVRRLEVEALAPVSPGARA